jgi:hypothetical protein
VSGLRWKHVDFDRALLMVERNNVQPKAVVIEKRTKSGTSPHVALDPYTMSLLEEHRERAVQRCNSIGCELVGDAWLFSLSPDGSTPYKPRSISQRYRRLATKLELRSTRFHALRHYSATELIAARVDVRTVAGRLGQSDGGATALRIYAKFVNEADRLAATTMAAIIPRPVVAPPAPRGPYETIAAQLRAQIIAGELRPGDQLPAIVDLAAAYTVSVGTAHRAVDLLKREALIEASRGKRATVKPFDVAQPPA